MTLFGLAPAVDYSLLMVSRLFAFGDPTFNSLALGGISTTLIALLAGLTLVQP